MPVFSFHLAATSFATTVKALLRPPTAGKVPGLRHAAAMVERQRKDFHSEFTTLRFRSLGEYGEWEGRSNFVPTTHPPEPTLELP